MGEPGLARWIGAGTDAIADVDLDEIGGVIGQNDDPQTVLGQLETLLGELKGGFRGNRGAAENAAGDGQGAAQEDDTSQRCAQTLM